MAKQIKSNIEKLLKKLNNPSKLSKSERNTILAEVEKELEEYRFENQDRIRKSQEELAKVVLNA